MGSVTVTIDEATVFGNRRVTYGTLAPSGSYASGGESYTAGIFRLGTLEKLFVFPAGGYVVEVDLTNSKVKILGQNPTSTSSGVIALEEVAAALDLSGNSFPFIAIGY